MEHLLTWRTFSCQSSRRKQWLVLAACLWHRVCACLSGMLVGACAYLLFCFFGGGGDLLGRLLRGELDDQLEDSRVRAAKPRARSSAGLMPRFVRTCQRREKYGLNPIVCRVMLRAHVFTTKWVRVICRRRAVGHIHVCACGAGGGETYVVMVFVWRRCRPRTPRCVPPVLGGLDFR